MFLSTIIEQFNTPTLFQLTVIFHGIVVFTGDNEWVFFFVKSDTHETMLNSEWYLACLKIICLFQTAEPASMSIYHG